MTFYLDTNIFVYYFKSKFYPDNSKIAKLFLEKIENGKYQGVISNLVLMELIKQLHEIAVEFEQRYSQADWKKEIEMAISTIYKIKNLDVKNDIIENNINLSYKDILDNGLQIMTKYQGSVETKSKIVHDGIHSMDAFHIITAKKLGCSKLATFDKDFCETKNEIPPLILQKDFW
ncbi:MAG: type II toxin-antitoxin system VapC family toxin [Nitrosarchaeum sp.]